MESKYERVANLDLMRALAISLVLLHHIVQFIPGLNEVIYAYARLGAHGVDIFFVLSGWLIGGLYWKEKSKNGSVNLLQFWLRRWFRTIPLYLFVFPIAFAGVYFSRGAAFDWGYLLFLQNYQTPVPYFLVSWSLAVEEHFYLTLPLLLILCARLKLRLNFILPVVVGLGLIARLIDPAALPQQPFGYAETATHLNFSGLAFGVWFSYLKSMESPLWSKIQRISSNYFFHFSLALFLLPWLNTDLNYFFGSAYITVLCATLLAMLTHKPTMRLAKSRFTYKLAVMSYSVYLTHSMVIHVVIKFFDVSELSYLFFLPCCLAFIILVGFLIYWLVEKPMMSMRARLIPSNS